MVELSAYCGTSLSFAFSLSLSLSLYLSISLSLSRAHTPSSPVPVQPHPTSTRDRFCPLVLSTCYSRLQRYTHMSYRFCVSLAIRVTAGDTL